jgi:hypothetical protein
MHFSKASLHHPVIVLPEHKAAIEKSLSALIREPQPRTRLAEEAADNLEVPLTTVSLNSDFDAYIDIFFEGAPATPAVQLLLDSGNSVLIVPRWEDIEALPNSNLNYEVLGQTSEPWGCPANIVRGPIHLATTSGNVYTLEDCLFYACTGDSPTEGSRTANFGAGCLSPWTASRWSTPLGTAFTMQAPLSYNPSYPCVEFNYAPAAQIHGVARLPKVALGSSLNIYKTKPLGYQMFDIVPNIEWMSLIPKSLKIGDTITKWPGTVPSPIAMIDTGGGPVFLSDPDGYVYSAQWPDPVANPAWTSNSTACQSTLDAITIELGDQKGSFSYTIDTSSWPSTVQGLTLVMCQRNSYMMDEQGMNIGGISALEISILVDFVNCQVGLKPKGR